ncbi:glycoside hydrolase domain-containing protein [Arthrobacter sp. AZCC_0090]|uniref:glycoside hydrolase domain-containing protein n=1 Tax=Arthrobacter sp. AZCC_0090 TaxID=2735881 RepID=UPI00160A9BC7|nr:glycoside hydrolase domain-containing protein [Arthrobacter sp. AZCC_0090]MBB6404284.1 hypothetical protein [Arthrobacter sp. AZCC_0090]
MQFGHTAIRSDLSGHPEVECGTGAWDKLLYGNHRFVVRVAIVDGEAELVGGGGGRAHGAPPTAGVAASRVILPWRRHDDEPASVEIVVVSAESGRRVRNVVVERAERESGQIVFEPVDGPGDYYFYYLPYAMLGKPHYPQAQYLPRRPSAEPQWAAAVEQSARRLKALGGEPSQQIRNARVIRYEAASARDSFAPMNFTATPDEVAALHERHPAEPFLLFPENRLTPISMRDALPAHWAIDGPCTEFNDTAQPGEDYIIQLGLYAIQDLAGVTVEVQPPTAGHCINTGGADRLGKPMSRTLTVPRGSVQALYTVLSIPFDAAGTTLTASVIVTADGGAASTVVISLDVLTLDDADPDILEGGFGRPEYLRRLAWLDSAAAQDRELVAPFTSVLLDEPGRRLSILGRQVQLAESGLPAQLTSTFTPAVTACDGPAVELLAAPFHFDITLADLPGGKGPLRWSYSTLEFTVDGPAQVSWRSQWTAGEPTDVGLSAELRGTLEADGACTISLRLTGGQPLEVDDAGLRLDFHEAVVPLAMGLGVPGGRRPEILDWTWDVADHNQDSFWLGSVNAGLQLALRDGNYQRPLNTNFYREKPLVEPASWANRQGASVQGGVALRTAGETVTLSAFSGSRSLAAGQTLDFDFRLLLTPFKPITPAKHLAHRFFHAPAEPEAIAASGATMVNVHHATAPAPYINDPLLTAGRLANYVEEAHRSGLKAKVYNTVRELTFHSPELLPLLSLGHEVFSDGPGLGHIWLQEHVGSGYVSAWFAPDVDDIAVVTSGESRWENFYVKSLAELVRRTGIDGIYLDDIAYDRHSMLRVRKVLERNCGETSGPDIDLHSANQFTARDGFASSANLYMEHMPYVDRLWFGEYFDYENTSPEYWLVELSGIPFGLMGEMLEGGGNPWRGMVFAMTGRAPAIDNRPLWRFWADNGLEEATMIGHWASDAPIRSSNPEVLTTTWLTSDGSAVVALASWAAEPVDVSLVFDGGAASALSADGAAGLAASPVTVQPIEGFQTAASYGSGQPITLEPKRGLLLTIGKH